MGLRNGCAMQGRPSPSQSPSLHCGCHCQAGTDHATPSHLPGALACTQALWPRPLGWVGCHELGHRRRQLAARRPGAVQRGALLHEIGDPAVGARTLRVCRRAFGTRQAPPACGAPPEVWPGGGWGGHRGWHAHGQRSKDARHSRMAFLMVPGNTLSWRPRRRRGARLGKAPCTVRRVTHVPDPLLMGGQRETPCLTSLRLRLTLQIRQAAALHSTRRRLPASSSAAAAFSSTERDVSQQY